MNPDDLEAVAQAITGTFMWSFKTGDNIVYNYEVIWELYKAKDSATASNKNKYIKPIILIQMSVIECILDDFVNRVVGHVNDRVPNISTSQIQDFKTKKRDKLEHYISAAKKHNLFDANDDFYTTMDILRKARNRFHIQNTKYTPPADESNLFTEALLRKSELVFEVVLERMMTKFFRGNRLTIQFANVPLPWTRVNPLRTGVHEDQLWLCIGCSTVYPIEAPFCPQCALPRP